MLNCKDNYGKLWAEKYISGKMSGGIGYTLTLLDRLGFLSGEAK